MDQIKFHWNGKSKTAAHGIFLSLGMLVSALAPMPCFSAPMVREMAPQVKLPVTFTLRKEIEVTAARLQLADVATCDGNPEVCTESYGVDLGHGPEPGKARFIRRPELLRILSREWPEADIRFSGSEFCKLSGAFRVMEPIEVRRALEGVVGAKFEGADGISATVKRVQLVQKPKVAPGEYHLEFPELDAAPLSTAKDIDQEGRKSSLQSAQSLDWLVRHLKGRQTLQVVHVSHGEDSHQHRTSFRAIAFVELEQEYPVAARHLPRHHRIRSEDIVEAFRPIRHGGVALVTDVKSLIGKRLKSSIRVGETFKSNQVERPQVIRRGQMVKLHLRRHGMSVTGYVKAAESGGFGDTIEAIYPKTAKRLKVRVKNSGLVESL